MAPSDIESFIRGCIIRSKLREQEEKIRKHFKEQFRKPKMIVIPRVGNTIKGFQTLPQCRVRSNP
jgi:hypothetical protein